MRKIWIVTKPDKVSSREDILFDVDAKGLELQFKGGLTGEEIVDWTFDEGMAAKIANDLMANKGVVSNMDEKILSLIKAGKTDEEIVEEIEKEPKETTGWWKITYTIEPNDVDLEHIAEELKKGYKEGQILQG